ARLVSEAVATVADVRVDIPAADIALDPDRAVDVARIAVDQRQEAVRIERLGRRRERAQQTRESRALAAALLVAEPAVKLEIVADRGAGVHPAGILMHLGIAEA